MCYLKSTLRECEVKEFCSLPKLKSVKCLCIFIRNIGQNAIWYCPGNSARRAHPTLFLSGLQTCPKEDLQMLGATPLFLSKTELGIILWHNYFTIFQFKLSWGLFGSLPEWHFCITKLRKRCTLSLLGNVERRHAGVVKGYEVCWDSPGGLQCGWGETSVLHIALLRTSSWRVLFCKPCPGIFSRNAAWHGHKSHWQVW